MFCPECGTERREGFTECSGRHAALVENPPVSTRRGRETKPWFPLMPKNVEGDPVDIAANAAGVDIATGVDVLIERLL